MPLCVAMKQFSQLLGVDLTKINWDANAKSVVIFKTATVIDRIGYHNNRPQHTQTSTHNNGGTTRNQQTCKMWTFPSQCVQVLLIQICFDLIYFVGISFERLISLSFSHPVQTVPPVRFTRLKAVFEEFRSGLTIESFVILLILLEHIVDCSEGWSELSRSALTRLTDWTHHIRGLRDRWPGRSERVPHRSSHNFRMRSNTPSNRLRSLKPLEKTVSHFIAFAKSIHLSVKINKN